MTPAIYLDCHATTPCDPRVLEAMLPVFSEEFGNASSQHEFGRRARERVEEARARVARLIDCDPREIVFTSGATESDNLAIKGAAAAGLRGRHVVTCATEHRAVLDCCRHLEEQGFDVTYLRVDGDGLLDPGDVEAVIRDDTGLVSLMYANNEIGVLHPIAEVGALCRKKGVLFHCDAVQALRHVACRVNDLHVDLLSLSGHKMYGPKGVGALYVRRRRPRARLRPIIDGGGHERGLRSGTLNVPAIVGLGKACEIVEAEREADARRVGQLRDDLLERILRGVPDARVNGSSTRRLPGNLNVTFPGVESRRLVAEIPGVAVSSGAACSSPTFDSSYVLKCLGRAEPGELGGIRFGLGRFTTAEEIERAAAATVAAVQRLRATPAPTADDACAATGEP